MTLQQHAMMLPPPSTPHQPHFLSSDFIHNRARLQITVSPALTPALAPLPEALFTTRPPLGLLLWSSTCSATSRGRGGMLEEGCRRDKRRKGGSEWL